MLKRVMRSGCVSCVHRVFLHASVVYVARGIEILDVLDIKIRVATLVRESTYLRSSHGSHRRFRDSHLVEIRRFAVGIFRVRASKIHY